MGMEQNFKLAVKSLMSSKARAILTMLGIIIGRGRGDHHHQPWKWHADDDERTV